MTNRLHVGFSKDIELPKSGFLLIDDEVPNIPRARIFDPAEHCFNPLRRIDYRTARELAVVLYALSPQGQDTLTVRNGKRALLPALLAASRLDRVKGDEEVSGLMSDLLVSPVLKRVLCTPTHQFSFNPNSIILAKLDRAVLGEFDALVLGMFLIAHYKGQLVIPDFGFYGREPHINLVRQNRLIAGINHFGELPLRLRQSLLSIKDKRPEGTLYEDAELLARFEGYVPDTVGFNDFVNQAMAAPMTGQV